VRDEQAGTNEDGHEENSRYWIFGVFLVLSCM